MQTTLDYYAGAVLNDPDRGSRYVAVTDQFNASGAGLNAPAPGFFPLGATAATAGLDGGDPSNGDYVGNPALRTGLYAFDTVGIQLLACPDTTAPAVVSASLDYCEIRGDAMFVGGSPRGFDLDGIKTYAGSFRGRKVFGALYAPQIQILNPLDANGSNPRLTVTPVGHVMGTYARIADARGVWKAPAGDEATLRGALGVEFDMTDTEHTDMVKNGGVNGIRALPGSGILIDSSRTLSTDSRWLFVGTRRLFNFVKSSLREGLRFVAQEPHDETLRRMVRFNVVTPFLLGLWRQGAFGSDPPEFVFTVKCDAENNPPADVNQGIFRVEVYFYPVKPAETILLIVGQQESGATASEA
jgi:phage tail sheath protein FI